MNTYSDVNVQLTNWKAMGMTKEQIVIAVAEACMGWPYVWGAYGQNCTVANREKFANGSSIGQGDRDLIYKRCQILNGTKGSCDGCKYYPGGKVLIFDCRGFTRWVLGCVGITLSGAGATSQYNTDKNWQEKGKIEYMPKDKVCCVFKHIASTGKMDHTGLYVGDGKIIHCSGDVKTGKITDKGWTHYAIPRGLDGGVDPVPTTDKPTIRKGSRGEYVTLLQAKLIQLGYDLSPYGADGAFGNKTLVAVKAFQQDRGLTADGIVGPKTWAALDDVPDQFPKKSTYSVTIHGLDLTQARALQANYPGSDLKEE